MHPGYSFSQLFYFLITHTCRDTEQQQQQQRSVIWLRTGLCVCVLYNTYLIPNIFLFARGCWVISCSHIFAREVVDHFLARGGRSLHTSVHWVQPLSVRIPSVQRSASWASWNKFLERLWVCPLFRPSFHLCLKESHPLLQIAGEISWGRRKKTARFFLNLLLFRPSGVWGHLPWR